MGVHHTLVKHIRKIIFIFFQGTRPTHPTPALARLKASSRGSPIGVHIFVRPRLQQRFASLLKTKDRHHTTSRPECQAGRRKNLAISMPGDSSDVGWNVRRWFGCRGDGLDLMRFVAGTGLADPLLLVQDDAPGRRTTADVPFIGDGLDAL